jgi:Zn finger protein HypA/HybF involved in hydrogenase expression
MKTIKPKAKPKCNCDLLEKLIATNWAYYRCPKCGAEYFSSGDARVIDKTDLGSEEERKAKGLKY